MSKYTGHILALFLGVTLTAGFYEGRRLIRNTTKAWTAAKTQVSGKEAPPNARRQALLKALEEEKGSDHVSQLRQQRSPRDEVRVRVGTNSQLRGARNVVQQRKTSLKDLPPQQREAIRERRRRRRDRLEEEAALPSGDEAAVPVEERAPKERRDRRDETAPLDDTALPEGDLAP
jgi:hypothetical protein